MVEVAVSDYIIKISKDLLIETNGPMLRYGIQSLKNAKLILPSHKIHWPDKERPERRYLDFLKAG
jgi:putative restriction endonuclease